MPKNGRIIVVPDETIMLVTMRPIVGWRVCMDYWNINLWTQKDNFPMSFMDLMLDYLIARVLHCFLYGYSGYNQISITSQDKEKQFFHIYMIRSHARGYYSYFVMYQTPFRII